MHEMAVAQGILAIALEAAGGRPVTRIRLRVGRLHALVPESLEFSFRLAAEHTPAALARLEMQEVPARVRCRACGSEGEPDLLLFSCPACGASEVEFVAGEELEVDAVESEGEILSRPRPAKREA